MKIYDISQEFMSSDIYPGDPHPSLTSLSSINDGAQYNLSTFSASCHNGTHVDAPSHFIKGGKTVGEIDLTTVIGEAAVIELSGIINEEDALMLIKKAQSYGKEAAKRLLIKGDAILMPSGAKVLLDSDILLIATESQSIGPLDAPMDVHKTLLGGEIILLEGINLRTISEGKYFLFAAPLNIGSAEGAPCRAILVDPKK